MPNLKVLYLNGNEMVKKVKSYRKNVIADLKGLRYLDDRPVFEDDRRHAEAFQKGGLDAERAERDVIKAEKRAAHDKMHNDFKELMRKAKEERMAELAKQGKSAPPSLTSSGEEPKTYEVAEDDDEAPALEEVDLEAERAQKEK
jgi:dynein assembly factor 1, axonemal